MKHCINTLSINNSIKMKQYTQCIMLSVTMLSVIMQKVVVPQWQRKVTLNVLIKNISKEFLFKILKSVAVFIVFTTLYFLRNLQMGLIS